VPWSIRMIAAYARELARAGYPALRFDFRGAGQSDGEFEQLTLSSCVSDLQHAVDVLVERTGVEEVVLIGWRLGATIAMRVGARDGRVRRLGLWDPVPDPHGNLQGVFRRARASMLAMGRTPGAGPGAANAQAPDARPPEVQPPGVQPMEGDAPGGNWGSMQPGQERLDAGGYGIGPEFRDELKSWDSSADVRGLNGQVLILQLIRGWSGAGGLRRALRDLADAYRAAGAEVHLAEAMDIHPADWFKQPDYSRVLEETSAWLNQGAAVAR